MTTRMTAEHCLHLPVVSADMAALMAGLRGVGGHHQQDGKTSHLRLVGDKLAQLMEGPIAVAAPLRFPNRRPLPNALQVFKGYRTTGVFGFRNKLLADAMVGVTLKPALATRQFSQATFGRFRADFLEALAARGVPLARALDMIARVGRTITIGCQMNNAHINPKHPVNITLIRVWDVTCCQQVPCPVSVNEIAFTLTKLKIVQLALSAHKRDALPPIQCPDRNRLIRETIGQNAVVIGDSTVGFERALRLLVQFVGIAYFGKHAHGHLGRQPKLVAHIPIDQLLQVKLLECLRAPCHLTDVVACGIGLLKRVLQRRMLIRRGAEFELGNNFHILKYSTNERLMQDPCGTAFLRPLKQVASCRFFCDQPEPSP